MWNSLWIFRGSECRKYGECMQVYRKQSEDLMVLFGVCSDDRKEVRSEIVLRVCTCNPLSLPTITVCMGALHVNSMTKSQF